MFTLRVLAVRRTDRHFGCQQPIPVCERFHSEPAMHSPKEFFRIKANKLQHNCCGYAHSFVERVIDFIVCNVLMSSMFRPDTQTYIQRLEQEKAEKMRGDKTDNRSFLAKYVSLLPLISTISQ